MIEAKQDRPGSGRELGKRNVIFERSPDTPRLNVSVQAGSMTEIIDARTVITRLDPITKQLPLCRVAIAALTAPSCPIPTSPLDRSSSSAKLWASRNSFRSVVGKEGRTLRT